MCCRVDGCILTTSSWLWSIRLRPGVCSLSSRFTLALWYRRWWLDCPSPERSWPVNVRLRPGQVEMCQITAWTRAVCVEGLTSFWSECSMESMSLFISCLVICGEEDNDWRMKYCNACDQSDGSEKVLKNSGHGQGNISLFKSTIKSCLNFLSVGETVFLHVRLYDEGLLLIDLRWKKILSSNHFFLSCSLFSFTVPIFLAVPWVHHPPADGLSHTVTYLSLTVFSYSRT